MASAIEVTKRQLYSDAHNRYESESIPIEDCRFKNFTDFLDEIDVFKNPVTSRGNGKFKKEIWSLLGYSTNTYRLEREEEGTDLLDDENDESLEQKQPNQKYDIKWEYTIFNGIFTDGISIERANKNEIEQAIKETERFLEKTFTKDLINDVNEIRDLQEQLLEQNNNEDLERIDICIITDKEILEQDRDRLPNKTLIQSINLECRIYYWDIRRWDAMKRSKSKREPINIDFSFNDYNSYKVPYLSKQTGASIDYYLAIFPGDLIADLYDLYNTRLLENNVRVFLSSTMKANKGIKDTIKSDPLKFFAYNNGISATAETIEINDGYISRIEDFQIVNGGQTTATIHFCRKKHKPPLSLNDVFVAVKITALQKGDEYSKIVGNISEAANTQSAISTSDFYTNDKKLVLLEQLSMKNPAQNEDDRNVYYFFERMKGQYNVQKSSQGTKTQQKSWENTYPNKLGFDKLDIARWSNMMNQLPFLVAEGAQKQFESYMKETYYERPELHLGTFKTIVGFGMIYRRIYKLCGTAQGKANLYPSRIIDSSTRQHVPVAASTAIYTASYLHMITEGRLDYWAIFDFEYDLCNSLLNPTKGKGQDLKRVNSKLDNILETFIDAIWNKIAIFGGAAAQEKSKKEECWNFVKKEVNVTKETLEELNFYLISNKELNKRESNQSNDDDLRYFNSLNILLENNGYVISRLYDIASASSEYISIKSTIFNLNNKIKQHEKILTAKRVEEVYSFYDNLIDEGFEFKHENQIIFENNLNVNNIYIEVFKDQNYFLNNLYNYICRDESNFNENEKLYKTAKEIIDNYYISYGLSVKELVFFNNIIKKLNQ
jgi:hypothetical protein